jgi:hypothetical protein
MYKGGEGNGEGDEDLFAYSPPPKPNPALLSNDIINKNINNFIPLMNELTKCFNTIYTSKRIEINNLIIDLFNKANETLAESDNEIKNKKYADFIKLSDKLTKPINNNLISDTHSLKDCSNLTVEINKVINNKIIGGKYTKTIKRKKRKRKTIKKQRRSARRRA